MRIKILDNSISILEQNCIGGKQVGIVSSSLCPEVVYNTYGIMSFIFLKGIHSEYNPPLRFKSDWDLRVAIKAINNWCRVNNESFRVVLNDIEN